MDGLFLELGPLKIVNGQVTLNPYSWHNAANILFVDQPVGTGLAYTKKAKYPKNDEELSVHFYRWLTEFFAMHSNYLVPGTKKTRPVFITGESHAGHYIPVFVKHILGKNAKAGSKDLVVDIGGVAIGNGWIDPFNQYDVSEFMHGLGVLSLGQKYTMKEKERACRGLLKKGVLSSQKCFALLDDVLASTGSSGTGRMVMYDARETSKVSGVYPPGHQEVEKYLNRKEVREALHASDTPQAFKECTDPPYNALAHQDGKGATEELAYVLDADIPVLLFAGQFDVICNHLGTERLLNRLKWRGRDAWLRAPTGRTSLSSLRPHACRLPD
jgi:carboxypeptidase D